MDHIVEGTQIWVPYIASPPYDDQGFSSFPARAGLFLNAGGKWLTHDLSVPKTGSIEAFLQSWLFFGVLREVLAGPISLEDFTVQVNYGSSHITTRKLPAYVDRWRAQVVEDGPKTTGKLIQARMVLDEAHSIVSKYCSVTQPGAKPLWDIMPELALSFSILGETLAYATTKIMSVTDTIVRGWLDGPSGGWGFNEMLMVQMQKDGWCPYSMHNLLERMHSSACGQLYALHVVQPRQLGLDHRHCSNNTCEARDAGLHNYCQQISGKECRCDYIPVNMEKLIAILRRDKIPILKFKRADQCVDVIEYHPGLQYAIISHVFADGYANGKSNTIRQCHLHEFYQIFERLSRIDQSMTLREAGERVETPIYFWIDALAIPLGDDYANLRRKTVKYMHDMYRKASFTIVLDKDLMVQRRGRTYSDAAMKILTSYWMTRLWTLQEACLSHRLLFIFRDTILDMDELERSYQEDFTSPLPQVTRRYFPSLLGPERISLRSSSAHKLLKDPEFLTSIWNALALRKTAVPQHEPLAIATLLGLNTDDFDNVDFNPTRQSRGASLLLSHKMRQLLEMIANVSDTAIPAGLVFLSRPRILEKGFSWAPQSWLKIPEADYEYLNQNQPAAKLTTMGLETKLPGFILHQVHSTRQSEIPTKDLVFPCDRSLETWVLLRLHTPMTQSQDYRLAVIIESVPLGRVWQKALLVELLRTVNRTLHSRILSSAKVRVVSDVTKVSTLTATWNDRLTQTLAGELKDTNTKWCIDGFTEQSGYENAGQQVGSAILAPVRFIYSLSSRLVYAREP